VNRTTPTLLAAVAALAALTGVAAVAAPDDGSAHASAASRKPVERSTLVCPRPSDSDVADTSYTAFTPKGTASAKGGKGGAELYPIEAADTDGGSGKHKKDKDGKGDGKGGKDAKPKLPLRSPGTPVTSDTSETDAPALAGSADGPLAPGWTVQQTTDVGAGAGRGLEGTACSVPDTAFWFPGASTSGSRQDYIHLTNPDDTSAVVDVDLYGKHGKQSSRSGEGITVPPRSTKPVLLSTLADGPKSDVTVHVVSRTGRVGAQVQAIDEESGGDWLPPTADPAPSAVLPGIPKDATSVRLFVHAPGENDADLKLRFAGKSSEIAPAGHSTVHARGGDTTVVELHHLTNGEAGSLALEPSGDGAATPVVAAAEVTRGKGGKKEMGFLPSTVPVSRQATAAGARGGDSTLALAATGKPARVRVTSSAGSGGGSPASRTYTVKGRTTRAVTPPKPKGLKGAYAVTVRRLSGGPLYASRMLEKKESGVPAFTLQTLPDDRGTVSVPQSAQDLSVLNAGNGG